MGDRRMRTAVVLDPHPLWLDAVRRVLSESDFTVAGATTSVDEAIELVGEHRPDLFVLEVMAEASTDAALAAIRGALERRPDLRVVVFSAKDDPDVIAGALAAGSRAYVLKTSSPDDVAFAIRHAFAPSLYLARSVPGEPPVREHANDDVAQLTKRELEILRLVAEGYTNVKLARKLWVTEQTVKFHLSNIYRKLDVSNRTEASRWAQTRGLLADAEAEERASDRRA